MIIRCPKCEFTRSVSESKIPATAELATCPKCKGRFRFRTLERGLGLEDDRPEQKTGAGPDRDPATRGSYGDSSGYEPEKRDGQDIWDTMDILNRRWEKQTEDTSVVARAQEELRHEKDPGEDASLTRTPEDSGPSAMDVLAEKVPAFRMPEEKAEPEVAPVGGPGAALETSRRDEPPSRDVSKGASAGTAAQPAPSRPFSYDDKDITPELRVERDLLMLKGDSDRPSRDLGRLDDVQIPGQVPGRTSKNAAPFGAPSGGPIPGPADPSLDPADPGLPPKDAPAASQGPTVAEIFSIPGREIGKAADISLSLGTDAAPSEDGDDDRIPLDIFEENMVETPWENPRSHGWFSGFTATVKKVMFSAPAFFSGLDPKGSLTSGYLFFLLQGYIAIVFSLLWRQAAARLTGLDFAASGTHLMLLVLLLLAPFALGLVQVFLAGCIRVLAHIIYPYEYPYNLVFKTVSYAAAPLVVSVVPFVGPVVGVLWFLVSLVLGCRYSLRLPWTAAILIPTPPALIMVALIAFFYI